MLILSCLAISFLQPSDISPAWSPDGTRIAFTRDLENRKNIWVIEIDTKRLTQITSEGHSMSPTWSSNGAKLAYGFLGNDNSEIRTVKLDGKGESTLILEAISLGDKSWSPKEDSIAYAGPNPPHGGIHILVLNIKTGRSKGLTTTGSYNDWPRWSPDGSKIAFSGGPTETQQIYVMRSDGSGLERVSQGRALCAMPCWSPDGRKLAYMSRRDGNADIYVVDLATKKETRMTDIPSNEVDPTWSPDGKRICVSSDQNGRTSLYTFETRQLPAKTLTPFFECEAFALTQLVSSPTPRPQAQ